MSDATEIQAPVDSNKVSVEKQEELKLRQKYPGLKGPGTTSFLQKRLSRGQKYFDSGDYNMAKAKQAMPPPSQPPKPTKVQVTGAAPAPPVIQPAATITDATGDAIPTPETLAIRKPSLIQSKLVTDNPAQATS